MIGGTFEIISNKTSASCIANKNQRRVMAILEFVTLYVRNAMPHSNAECERIFSETTDLKTKKRSVEKISCPQNLLLVHATDY